MGLVQFQIAPRSSLHVSISIGPFRCGRSYLQGFYSVAPVPSEAVPFVYLASVCQSLPCLISALTQAGGGGLLFRFASSITLREGRGTAFPSTLLRLPPALYGAGPALRAVPVFGSSTRAQTRLRMRFVPCLARAAQAARSLTGALSRVRRAFSPPRLQPQFPPAPVGCVYLEFSHDPPGGCRPSRISGSLWLETGGLFAVW